MKARRRGMESPQVIVPILTTADRDRSTAADYRRSIRHSCLWLCSVQTISPLVWKDIRVHDLSQKEASVDIFRDIAASSVYYEEKTYSVSLPSDYPDVPLLLNKSTKFFLPLFAHKSDGPGAFQDHTIQCCFVLEKGGYAVSSGTILQW